MAWVGRCRVASRRWSASVGTETSDVRSIATPPFVAPPPRPVPGAVEEESATAIAPLQPDKIGGVEQSGRRPGDRPKEARELVDLVAQPPPAVPPNCGPKPAFSARPGEDSIEGHQVDFAGTDPTRLGVEQALEHAPEPANFQLGSRCEGAALEELLGAAGEVDKVETEDSGSARHVITITYFGDYCNDVLPRNLRARHAIWRAPEAPGSG